MKNEIFEGVVREKKDGIETESFLLSERWDDLITRAVALEEAFETERMLADEEALNQDRGDAKEKMAVLFREIQTLLAEAKKTAEDLSKLSRRFDSIQAASFTSANPARQ